MLKIKVINKDNYTKDLALGENEVRLVHNQAYKEGEIIVVESDKTGIFLVIQLDDAIGENIVFIKGRSISYTVPFGENKTCLSPKSFWGDKHLLTVRMATKDEIASYKNLAINKYDQHAEATCFPHALANVETRGESVFAAKNAIDGNSENHSHGEWPYESWGINQDLNAAMKVEFGRNVIIDKIRMYTRADFPHDAWWRQVTFQFSDGSAFVWNLEKTDKAHEITFEKKTIEWLELCNLIKADDSSPFPALSQLEVYGIEQETFG
jgi:hypothetical protein